MTASLPPARGPTATDHLWWTGGWEDLPVDMSTITRHYGGLFVPFRIIVWWNWLNTLPPGSPWLSITPTPMAWWITALAGPSAAYWWDEGFELVPARKIWPERGYGCIGLEYFGGSIDPDRYRTSEYVDILWKVRSIYHSPALNSTMPEIAVYAEIQYCDM